MKHSIIVGYGLAGLSYASQLKQNQEAFVIIDNPKANATRKAAGVLNPTVLKRYTLVWNAHQFLSHAQNFYQQLEVLLQTSIFDPLPIHRHFSDVSEQNHWVTASNSVGLQPYLETDFLNEKQAVYKDAFGYGNVKQTGRLKTKKTLEAFKSQLNKNEFFNAAFEYDALKIFDDYISYKNIKAKNIVFCEGYGLKNNPFFNTLPLVGSKGELLLIKASQLPRDHMIKAHGIFIVPVEDQCFWIGASFNPKDKTTEATQDAKEWLLKRLEKTIDVPFEIITQNVCIRPTVIDRRPLLGQHPVHKNLYLFNGLGTRGVLMSPLLSQWIFELISHGSPLPDAVDLNRFDSLTL